MGSKRITNPLSRYGFWLIIVVFAYLGLSVFTGNEEFLSATIDPVLLVTSIFAAVWVVFQYKTGRLTLINQNGVAYTYTQKENPILFHLLIVVIFVASVFLAISVGSDFFLGCEGSLINSCGATYEVAP